MILIGDVHCSLSNSSVKLRLTLNLNYWRCAGFFLSDLIRPCSSEDLRHWGPLFTRRSREGELSDFYSSTFIHFNAKFLLNWSLCQLGRLILKASSMQMFELNSGLWDWMIGTLYFAWIVGQLTINLTSPGMWVFLFSQLWWVMGTKWKLPT